MSNNRSEPTWDEEADGSRVRLSNGIRIVDRTTRGAKPGAIEHLVTWEEGGGTVLMGLDAACRPVYVTTL
jgi:hypothetical protein